MKRILLIEDDPILGKSIKINLELEGFETSWRQTLASGSLELHSNKFDLIILDLGLPDGSGLDYCKNLTLAGNQIPIIILTAQTDENSIVTGFKNGATDYVRKPFGNRELIARIKAHLKQFTPNGHLIKYKNITIDLQKREVLYNQKTVELNRRKFDLFAYLMRNPGVVISREGLISILGMETDITDRTIDAHVSQLRRSLKNSEVKDISITSVYGVGYRLEKL